MGFAFNNDKTKYNLPRRIYQDLATVATVNRNLSTTFEQIVVDGNTVQFSIALSAGALTRYAGQTFLYFKLKSLFRPMAARTMIPIVQKPSGSGVSIYGFLEIRDDGDCLITLKSSGVNEEAYITGTYLRTFTEDYL